MKLTAWFVPSRLPFAVMALAALAMACSSKGTISGNANCNALAACCSTSSFPAAAMATCTSTVKGADDAACQANLSAYSSLGLCSGHGGSSGTGGTSTSSSGTGGTSTSSSSGTGGTSTSSSGTGAVGPIIQSLTANPTPVTPAGTTISAIVSDSAGISALTGGTLIDKVSGTTYGAFATPGGQGTFVYPLTWSALYQAQAISFAAGGSTQRVVTARFFDEQAHMTSQDLTLTLECGTTTGSPCSAGCEDFATDPNNCGSCGNACASTEVCTKAYMDCSCGAGHCSAVVISTTVAGASCNAMCQNVGATCVANVCATVSTGAGGPNYEPVTCSDTSYSQHVCCCQH